MGARSAAARLPPRPRRGAPDETRQRLVAVAADVFNREGYDGTDSNRIARAAGYAPGTFYKHFADKKQIFLAVYEEWVAREWRDIGESIAQGGAPEELAGRIVDVYVAHHRRWRGFRASLRALVPVDEEIRAAQRELRRRQLAWIADHARRRASGAGATREQDALLLLTLERAADAIADGETEALRLRAGAFRALLVDRVAARLA
jgi:AcrR family transcriptional regulator